VKALAEDSGSATGRHIQSSNIRLAGKFSFGFDDRREIDDGLFGASFADISRPAVIPRRLKPQPWSSGSGVKSRNFHQTLPFLDNVQDALKHRVYRT
jgi:hypothetical protein